MYFMVRGGVKLIFELYPLLLYLTFCTYMQLSDYGLLGYRAV
jgi:hypothetical protein